jgi:hypothetical protein
MGRFIFVGSKKFDSQSLLPERQILNSPVLFFQVPFTWSAVTSFWGWTPVATNENVRETRIFFMFKSSTGSKPVRNKHDRTVPTMGILNMMPLQGKQFARGIWTKPGDPGPDTGSLSISVTDRRSRTTIGAKLKRSKRLTKRFPLGKQPPSGSNAQKALEVMATGRFDALISDIGLRGCGPEQSRSLCISFNQTHQLPKPALDSRRNFGLRPGIAGLTGSAALVVGLRGGRQW